jgi:glutathione S-transferase
MSPNKLVVHHLNDSRSERILWLLVRHIHTVAIETLPSLTLHTLAHYQEELEVPYEIKVYKRDQNKLAPIELQNIHPLGKSPVITDGDVTLAESGAIIRACVVFSVAHSD